jgi:hypothetical protein
VVAPTEAGGPFPWRSALNQGPGTLHARAAVRTEAIRVALPALLPGDPEGEAMRVRLLRRRLSTLFD